MPKKRRSSRSSARSGRGSGRGGGAGPGRGPSTRPTRPDSAGSTTMSGPADDEPTSGPDATEAAPPRARRGASVLGRSRGGARGGASAVRGDSPQSRVGLPGRVERRAIGVFATLAQRAETLRGAVEQRSDGPLRRLSRLPRWLLPLLVGVLLLAGLILGNWLGILALVVVGVFLTWLTFLSWPRLTANARLLRVAMLGLLAGVALAFFFSD